jgi:hypothetical protein
MYWLRSLGSRDLGFESHSGHGCLMFVYVRFSVFVYRQRPCDELITRPRSPTDCLWFRKKPKLNGEFRGGRPRPTGAVVPMKKKTMIFTFVVSPKSRSQWPRCLRYEMSSVAQILGPWVPIAIEVNMYVSVFSVLVLCFIGSGFVIGWSLV